MSRKRRQPPRGSRTRGLTGGLMPVFPRPNFLKCHMRVSPRQTGLKDAKISAQK